MASVLEGFLVRLGFEIDKDEQRKFSSAIDTAEKRLVTLGKVGVALGTSLAIGIAKSATEVNKLTSVANNTGTSVRGIMAMERAFEKVGGNAAEARGAIQGFADHLKKMDAASAQKQIKQLFGVDIFDKNGKARDMTEVIMEIARSMDNMSDLEARAAANAVGLGSAYDSLRKKGIGDEFDKANKRIKLFGENINKNTTEARNLGNALGDIWQTIKLSSEQGFLDISRTLNLSGALNDLNVQMERWLPSFFGTIDQYIRDYKAGKWTFGGAISGIFQSFFKGRAAANIDDETLAEWERLGVKDEILNWLNSDKKNSLSEKAKAAFGMMQSRADAIAQRQNGGAVAGGAVANVGGARGIRNNNPLNIRHGGSAWQGAVAGGDRSFVTFQSPEMGIRAGVKTLQTYKSRGATTLSDVISRWSPPNENNTAGYIARVSQMTGFAPNQQLDLDDPTTLRKLLGAMTTVENGRNPYSDAVLDRGIALGLGRNLPTPQAMGTPFAGSPVAREAAARGAGGGGNVNNNQRTVSINQTINVNGAASPEVTGQRIAAISAQTVRNANFGVG